MTTHVTHLENVLLAPHVTEKAARLSDKHKTYVFRVQKGADKATIKRATEAMFGVKVDSVRVMNVKGKMKRAGGRPGGRSSWKKAYVTLMTGFDINFMGKE